MVIDFESVHTATKLHRTASHQATQRNPIPDLIQSMYFGPPGNTTAISSLLCGRALLIIYKVYSHHSKSNISLFESRGIISSITSNSYHFTVLGHFTIDDSLH